MKHTKGEWVAKKEKGPYSGTFNHVSLIDGVRTLAIVYGETPQEQEANAKLIAAAPDLLQIAKRVAFMLDAYPSGSMGKELAEEAKAAIKKATV